LCANRNDSPTFLTLELDLTRAPGNIFGHIALTFGEDSLDLSFNEWAPLTLPGVQSSKDGETKEIFKQFPCETTKCTLTRFHAGGCILEGV